MEPHTRLPAADLGLPAAILGCCLLWVAAWAPPCLQAQSEQANPSAIPTFESLGLYWNRAQAVGEIDAERQKALGDVRAQVAELALQAAGKVVGETMSDQRERRLVDEFLAQVTASAPSGGDRN